MFRGTIFGEHSNFYHSHGNEFVHRTGACRSIIITNNKQKYYYYKKYDIKIPAISIPIFADQFYNTGAAIAKNGSHFWLQFPQKSMNYLLAIAGKTMKNLPK